MDIIDIAAAKSYVRASLDGVGALAGKNAVIRSITKTGDTNTVTFEWTSNSGVVTTDTMVVKDGADGTSITNVSIDTNNHLIVTYSDSTTVDAGLIPTVKGDKGDDGKSAYEVAVDNGYVGTVEEWLDSLVGEDGKSAYEIAVEQGYTRTEEEWVESLEGFSPEITVYQNTDDTYKLQIVTKDATIITPNLKGGGSGEGQTIQVTELPTADLSQFKKVYQYIGATTQDYTHNYFYECSYDSENDIFYWKNVKVQDGGGDSDHFYGTSAQWEALTDDEKATYKAVLILDDPASGFMNVSDIVQENDYNPVTSNAVYEAIQSASGTSIDDDNISSKTTYSSYKITNELDKAGKVKSVNGKDNIVVLDKTDIGLDQVDNTSDADKPISNAQATVNTAVDTRLTTLEGKKVVLQFTTMPDADTLPEQIVEFTGTTDSTYTRGYMYRSTPITVGGNLEYEWQRVDVQPSNSDYEVLDNHPTIENIEVVGDKTLADFGAQKIMQYTVFPTPSSAISGSIGQYIGSTNAQNGLYNGFWYRCQYDAETASYKWKQIDVSTNSALDTRITTLETNQGDMSELEITGVTDLVTALNTLNNRGLQSITYVEPNLTITNKDGSTYVFNLRAVLDETQLGELADVIVDTIQDTNTIAFDSSINRYKPYDIVGALTNLLQTSKDYTDDQIQSSIQTDAYVCDVRPTYDAENDLVIYTQNNIPKTTSNTDSRFYYYDSNNRPFCISWIEGVSFEYALDVADFSDYVNKNTDLTNTYTEDMVDKTKVPTVASLDALLTIVKIALALKVNTDDIADNLTTNDATKVLSAKQGKELKTLVDTKQNIMQYGTMPTADSTIENMIVQYVGISSNAFTSGFFYKCVYDTENDTYIWQQIKYSAETDTTITENGTNPVTGGAIYTALQGKQDKTLATPITVNSVQQTSVEGTLNALNTYLESDFVKETDITYTTSADLASYWAD